MKHSTIKMFTLWIGLSALLASCAPPMADPKTTAPTSSTSNLPAGTSTAISSQLANQMAGTYAVTLEKRDWMNQRLAFNTQMIIRNHSADGQRWMSLEVTAFPNAGGSTVNFVKYLGGARGWNGEYILMSGYAQEPALSDSKFSIQFSFYVDGSGRVSPFQTSAELKDCSFSNNGYCQNSLQDAWFATDLRRL